MNTSVFHPGEVALQQRVGVHAQLAPRVAGFIRDAMPEQHRAFFALLPTLWVGSVDDAGRPWASVLTGMPGFAQSPDPRHLAVAAVPLPGDPLAASLRVGRPLGLLGLQPQTRRRNRLNGTVVAAEAEGFVVEVDQSFGNCPQYIQARTPQPVPATASTPQEHGGLLAPQARALVAGADTLFIATAVPEVQGHGGALGADVSHRGGRPGFVRVDEVDGRCVLTWPDFRGNQFFNTLGNIALNPRAGLLFVDHGTGDVLQLTGDAEIVWDGPELAAFAGAQRLVRVAVVHGRWWPQALPLRWSAPEQAPQLAATGAW